MLASEQKIRHLPWRHLAITASIWMALALHIQPTLTLGGHTFRASLSDLVLLPLLVFPMALLRESPLKLPCHCLLWAAGLCAMLTIAYVRGVHELGTYTSWATSKLFGSYLLVAYFVIGAAVAIIGGRRARTMFAVWFVLMASALVLTFLVVSLLPAWHGGFLGAGWRFTGLTDNPNAEGLILLLALYLGVTHTQAIDNLLVPKMSWVLIILLVTGLLLTTSAAAWGGAAVSILLLLALRVITARKLGLVLVMALGIAMGLASLTKQAGTQFQLDVTLQKFMVTLDLAKKELFPKQTDAGSQSTTITPHRLGFFEKSARNESIAPRAATNRAAIQMWWGAPIIGQGLGVFLERQRDKKIFGDTPIQIHNTLLWLLAETGLIGSGLFLGFLICASIPLVLRINAAWKADNIEGASFAVALFAFGISWQLMSLAHELMYQRHVWFALGMALARGQSPGRWR